MVKNIIEIKSLVKQFGDFRAVDEQPRLVR
jgi:hypothetical protein